MSYPVGRSCIQRRWLVLLTVAVGVQQLITCPLFPWITRLDTVPWLGVALLAWGVLARAWAQWRHAPQGWLSWVPDSEAGAGQAGGGGADGVPGPAQWWWSTSDGSFDVPLRALTCPVGWGGWRLLRLHAHPGSVAASWVWVEQSTLPVRWVALCRALVSHATWTDRAARSG